ncbi:hypothetical protein AAVH_24629 [Aphelenchoides avenae]|nr:hypothetical protein AAVH_24629 [Aphelenchus avenae]
MNVHEMSSIEVISSLRDRPARVEVACAGEPSICGHVYTVDPETRTVALLQFDEKEGVSKVVLVPGASVKSITPLTTEEAATTAGIVHDADTVKRLSQDLFRNDAATTALSEEDVQKRRQKLIACLDAARLPHTDGADGAVIVHNVQIRPPYTRESVVSDNQMAMKRTMDMLARFFEE